jgi:hypothetical protein
MRKGRPKYPQPRDVGPVVQALRLHVPMDAPMAMGMRESLSHVPNFRLIAQTNEIQWTVDVYKGPMYHVQIRSQSERFVSIPPLIQFIFKWTKV